MIQDQHLAQQARLVPFGQRPVPPRACVVDNKPHVRSFIAEALSDLGFITHECVAPELATTLADVEPDLIVAGPLDDGGELPALLRKLIGFGGKVMLFGGRSASSLVGAHEIGEQLGLAMLPPLGTPFRQSDLTQILSCFLPIAPSPAIGVDVDEALRKGWLELWYQPKIDPRSLTPSGAEALVRVRHPTWGLVAPAYFIPSASDPYYHALSQFVIMHAMADWMRFAADGARVDISVSLPSPVLEDPDFIAYVFGKLPAGAADGGLLIAADCASALADVDVVRKAGAQLAFRHIGIALDALGPEGAMLVGRRDLPVVEMKVQSAFVCDCSNDRIRQAVCAHIVAAARENGARAVAGGVANHADFVMLRELGFDLVQGPMFAKPMDARKFARCVLGRRFAVVS
jgi:EAL domain-containing protein (putative c-di-GMP-specific phosphodiesterase class I)